MVWLIGKVLRTNIILLTKLKNSLVISGSLPMLKSNFNLFGSVYKKMECHLRTVSVLNSPVMYFVPGFEITIDHPHTDVVKCSQLVRGRGFLLCSLCPLLLSVPPQIWVGRGSEILPIWIMSREHIFFLIADLSSPFCSFGRERHALVHFVLSPRLICKPCFYFFLIHWGCWIKLLLQSYSLVVHE